MKCKAITKFILELDESEAKFLLDMTQNPLRENESEEEEEFREKIWDVLKKRY